MESGESGKISGFVTCKGGPIRKAEVDLFTGKYKEETKKFLESTSTSSEGAFEFNAVCADGAYHVACTAFGETQYADVEVRGGAVEPVPLSFKLDLALSLHACTAEGMSQLTCGVVGKSLLARVEFSANTQVGRYQVSAMDAIVTATNIPSEYTVRFEREGTQRINAVAFDLTPGPNSRVPAEVATSSDFAVLGSESQLVEGRIDARLHRTFSHPTLDQALWVAIRNRTHAISFPRYREFINRILCAEEREGLNNPVLERQLKDLGTHLHGVAAYQVMKLATQVFLLVECGVRIEEGRGGRDRAFDPDGEAARLGKPVTIEYAIRRLEEYLGSPPQLPYITRVIRDAFPEFNRRNIFCDRALTARVNEPCLIELIWSYWLEEGMLAQSMNAITRRFQNVRAPGSRDPLAHLEIDPLRPLNNLVWGFIQDEPTRLSVRRRAYEYEHEYGLQLYGKAVTGVRPADTRSKFLEGFHNLMRLCSIFFKEDNDTTVIADGYPLLNALKEVHLTLAQGAHNQFGDLPWTARSEMLLQQWMLARPEIRDFLQSRAMVPYKEAWMPQVDTMKTMQGWTDVTITHFRDLAVYGEQILLSIRYGDWIEITFEDSAKNWARYWRPEIQAYLHAYRAATGIDLTSSDTVDATVPAVHLQRRLAIQHGER
jgi:hypothetical protein